MGKDTKTDRVAERRSRYFRGHRAEWLAAALLMAKGHRILARREKTPAGEIDLIAVKGRRLAFVEVKQRASDEAADAAISGAQRRRIEAAADLWLARHAAYHGHDITFDVVFIVPGRWPRHIVNGL